MIYEQILRFEVPVDDILLMEVHESVHDFNKIEAGVFFPHAFNWFEVVKKLTPRTVVQDKTHEIMRLETMVQFHYERVVQHTVYRLLVFDYRLLLVLADKPFHHHFHRVKLTISQAAHQIHFAEPPYS